MSKNNIDDDDIIFRDLDGTIDNTDNETLKDQESTFEDSHFMVDENLEIEDASDSDSVENNESSKDSTQNNENQNKNTTDESDDTTNIAENLLQQKQENFRDNTKEVAELKQKLWAAESEKVQMEYVATKEMENRIGTELNAVRAALIKATEDGETEKQVEIQERLHQLISARNVVESHRNKIEKKLDDYKEYKESKNETHKPQQDVVTEGGKKWLNKNATWLNNADKSVKEFILKVDDIIEGDPNSPEYFDTMNNMIKARYPHINPTGIREGKPNNKPPLSNGQKRSPVADVSDTPTPGSSTNPQKSSSNKVIIDTNDKKKMREFGLDPNNKAHLHAWAQEKRKIR
jgi:hypothetical protein